MRALAAVTVTLLALLVACGDGRLSPQGGTITGVNAGSGLTGGGYSGVVTLNATATSGGGLEVTADGLGLTTVCTSGQVLSWNGTAWTCATAGSVAGTGAANYLTKWSDAVTLTTSQVYESGSQVYMGDSAYTNIANDLDVLTIGNTGTGQSVADTSIVKLTHTGSFTNVSGVSLPVINAFGAYSWMTPSLTGSCTNVLEGGVICSRLNVFGVRGYAAGTLDGGPNGSVHNYGGRFSAVGHSGGFGYGIYAEASGAGTLYAGYFDGNVFVLGDSTFSGNVDVTGNLTGTANVNMGDALGDAHSLKGTFNVNGTAGANGEVLTIVAGYPQWQAPTSGGGDITDVVAGTGLTGGGSSGSVTVSVASNGITDALLRQSAGLSVVGRSANTTGNVADITAASDGDVLRRSGTTLGFGAIPQSSVTSLTTDLSNRPTGSGTSGRSTRWTGTSTLSNGAFTDDGTNATANGTLASTGAFTSGGNVIINSNELHFQNTTDADADGYINFFGYGAAGTTRFRNTIIGDGKGATACTVTGSTKSLDCVGGLTENSSPVLSGTIAKDVIPKGDASGNLTTSGWTDAGSSTRYKGAGGSSLSISNPDYSVGVAGSELIIDLVGTSGNVASRLRAYQAGDLDYATLQINPLGGAVDISAIGYTTTIGGPLVSQEQVTIRSGNALVWNNAANSSNGQIYYDGAELVSAGAFWVNAGNFTVNSGVGKFGGAASATRYTEFNSSGVETIRYDDNALQRPLVVDNRGITGANQGAGILFEAAAGAAAGVPSVSLDALTENSTHTGATADGRFSLKVALNGTLTERLLVQSDGTGTYTGSWSATTITEGGAAVFSGSISNTVVPRSNGSAFVDSEITNDGTATSIGNADSDYTRVFGDHYIRKTGADSAPSVLWENDAVTWSAGVRGASADDFAITAVGVATHMSIARANGAVVMTGSGGLQVSGASGLWVSGGGLTVAGGATLGDSTSADTHTINGATTATSSAGTTLAATYSGTGQTADRIAVNVANSGTFDTTGDNRDSRGINVSVSGGRSAGGNSLSQTGLWSVVTNGQQSNYGVVSFASGAASNIAYWGSGTQYSFYGNLGTLFNAGAAQINGNATLGDSTSADTHTINGNLTGSRTYSASTTNGLAGLNYITSGTFDTTAGLIENSGLNVGATSTRSAGSNNLFNYGIYAAASGGTFNIGVRARGTQYSFYGDIGDVFNAGALTINGNATLGDSTSADTHTINGATGVNSSAGTTLTVDYTGTGLTSDRAGANVVAAGTFDATAALRKSYGVIADSHSTRSAGSNNVYNYGLYASANGGQVNYALITNFGDVLLNAASGSTTINGNTTIGDSLGDLHTINGYTTIGSDNAAYTLTINQTNPTGRTNDGTRALQVNYGGTLNTTASALSSYGAVIQNTATRSAGSNNLTNYAGYFTASGGQVNYALYTSAGDVLLNAASGTTTISGGTVSLNNGTSNMITWAAAGVSAPTFTTRSVGTKLVLYPQVGAAAVDYALGIEGSTLWYSVPDNTGNYQFKWYGGTTQRMMLTSDGQLLVGNNIRTDGNELHFESDVNNNSTGYINWFSNGAGGTTYFRDTIIGDGKGVAACTVTASTKTMNCAGGVQVNGTSVVTTANISGTTNTYPIFTGTNSIGNSTMLAEASNRTRLAKSSSIATIMVGDDTDLTTNAQSGWKAQAWSDGNIYIDSKVITSGSTIFRSGAGTETGAARTWLTLTNSTGATSFAAAMTASSTLTVNGNATLGDASTDTVYVPGYASIGAFVTDPGSYLVTNWNSTGNPVPLYIRSPTNNGGYTGGGAFLGPMKATEPVLVLARNGISGESYANFAEFKLGHAQNSNSANSGLTTGVESRTRLDIALTYNNGEAAGLNVLSLVSPGLTHTDTGLAPSFKQLSIVGASGLLASVGGEASGTLQNVADMSYGGVRSRNFARASDTLDNTNSTNAYQGYFYEVNYPGVITHSVQRGLSPRGVYEDVGYIVCSVASCSADFRTALNFDSSRTGMRDVRKRTFTFSVWAKRASGTGTIGMAAAKYADNDTFISNSCSINSTSWTRCVATGSTNDTTRTDNSELRFYFNMQSGAANVGVYLYGVQIEEGGQVTPYVRSSDLVAAYDMNQSALGVGGYAYTPTNGSTAVYAKQPGSSGNSYTITFSTGGTAAGTFVDGRNATYTYQAGVTTTSNFCTAIASSNFFKAAYCPTSPTVITATGTYSMSPAEDAHVAWSHRAAFGGELSEPWVVMNVGATSTDVNGYVDNTTAQAAMRIGVPGWGGSNIPFSALVSGSPDLRGYYRSADKPDAPWNISTGMNALEVYGVSSVSGAFYVGNTGDNLAFKASTNTTINPASGTEVTTSIISTSGTFAASSRSTTTLDIINNTADSGFTSTANTGLVIDVTGADTNTALTVVNGSSFFQNTTLGDSSTDAHALNGTLNANSTAGTNGQVLTIVSGVPQWAAVAGNVSTAGGTTNVIPKFTASSTLGNSSWTDTGTTTTTTGNLTVNGNFDLQGVLSDSNSDVTISDGFIVTGTSDLRGSISNSTGTVTVSDDFSASGVVSLSAIGVLTDVKGDLNVGTKTAVITFNNGPVGVNTYNGKRLEFTEEFLGAPYFAMTTGQFKDFEVRASGTSASLIGATSSSGQTARPGVAEIHTGVQTTSSTSLMGMGGVSFSQGDWTWESTVQLSGLSVVGTNEYSFAVGFTSLQALNGCFFFVDKGKRKYTYTPASGTDHWGVTCRTNNNTTHTTILLNGTTQSSVTTVNTPVAAGTWYRLRVVLTGTTSAAFYINGTLVATITTTIPTSATNTDIGYGLEIRKSVGTTDYYAAVDQALWSVNLTAARNP